MTIRDVPAAAPIRLRQGGEDDAAANAFPDRQLRTDPCDSIEAIAFVVADEHNVEIATDVFLPSS